MVSLTLIRISFVFICGIVAYSLTEGNAIFAGGNPFIYAVVGSIMGLIVVMFEMMVRRISLKGLSSSVFGILLGLI